MKVSGGLLLHRRRGGRLEVLLVHPGGPFWRRREDGAWSIPKGECGPGEESLEVALREFEEELGTAPPRTGLVRLGQVRQAGGKVVEAWTAEADLEVEGFVSNTFEIEWPPRSGRRQAFPEVDRAGWFDLDTARRLLNPAQVALLDLLPGGS